MTPWLQDPDVTLYHGDCLDVLRQLPDRSVHMCATSPPFYGLRDYGTGEWEGGDPGCDHSAANPSAEHIEGVRRSEQYKAEGRSIGELRADGTPRTDGHHGGWKGRAFRGDGGPVCRCGARRVDQQIGLEETPDQWVERLVAVFREVRRVLRDDGTLWVEIGDSFNSGTSARRKVSDVHDSRSQYAEDSGAERINAPGMKTKDLLGQPWLLAFALRADGWYLRSEIIWARPNPMPESVTDRPTKSHSTVFLLSKSARYFYDADAIREPHQHDGRHVTQVVGKENSEQHRNGERWPGSGANARSVWTIPTEPTPFAHFATWPRKLVARMILAGTSERGCCPVCGAPWVRDVERTPMLIPERNAIKGEGSEATPMVNDGARRRAMNGQEWAKTARSTTLGWSPSCAHDHQPVPCTVLDPFAGSGTTCLVARNHGRHSIGIELNQAYLEIAAKRLQQLSLLAEA